jgi:16S rRNA (guanine966-N2)-methyltransferase
MRITGGLYRGRRIDCPPGDIRPAMDRMRVSLFSVLGDLSELSFLDLFSGSGIMGVEAASRGADPVVLVEKDPRKKATILKNIRFVESGISLSLVPAERFLRSDRRAFHIVFLDPPFALKGKEALLDEVASGGHVTGGGLVIMHLHRAEKLETGRPLLRLEDRREYGQSLVLLFRAAEHEPPYGGESATHASTGPAGDVS